MKKYKIVVHYNKNSGWLNKKDAQNYARKLSLQDFTAPTSYILIKNMLTGRIKQESLNYFKW